MSDPRLSVIVPVYNAERFLDAALTSISEQCPPSCEIVVVDDGSTDGSAEIARRYPAVRYLRQENGGPAAARNTGVAHSRGRLLAFLDADDLWVAGKLDRQLPLLSADTAAEIVTGHIQCLQLCESGDWEEFGETRCLPSFGSSIVTRVAWDQIGPLDESLRCAEDVDWFMRARGLGIPTVVADTVVLFYRLHGANITATLVPQQAGYTQAVRKLLAQRRSEQRR